MLHKVECVFQPDELSLWSGGQRKRRIKSGRNWVEGGGRDDEGGKGGGVFNMGIKSMYI